jgi:RES domain-containing protein
MDDISCALSITSIEISGNSILLLKQAHHTGNWQQVPAPSSTKDFGTALLKQNQYLTLQIPSVVIPEEYNYLINPLHPRMKKVRVVKMKDCVYDLRIKGR